MKLSSRVLGVAAAVALLAGVAPAPVRAGGTDYFAARPETDTVSVRRQRPRTPGQRLLIAGLLGGGVLAGGVGLYFHLGSRDAANEVSAIGDSTALTWTAERQDTYDRAFRDRTVAIVGYSVGGALMIGALVAAVLTDPGSEEVVIGPDGEVPPAAMPLSLALLPGGVAAEATWRW